MSGQLQNSEQSRNNTFNGAMSITINRVVKKITATKLRETRLTMTNLTNIKETDCKNVNLNRYYVRQLSD